METKIAPNFFEGIKYISLYDLPADQAHLFSEWIPTNAYVKKAESDQIGFSDAVHYDQYDYWFHNHYLAEKDWDQIL